MVVSKMKWKNDPKAPKNLKRLTSKNLAGDNSIENIRPKKKIQSVSGLSLFLIHIEDYSSGLNVDCSILNVQWVQYIDDFEKYII